MTSGSSSKSDLIMVLLASLTVIEVFREFVITCGQGLISTAPPIAYHQVKSSTGSMKFK